MVNPIGYPSAAPAGVGGAARHPLDPEERTSTKAAAVLVLGITGLALSFCGGGVLPAAVALLLARPTREEIVAAQGFLTGGRAVRAGTVLATLAVVVSAVVLVLVVVGLLIDSVGTGPTFDENVN
ncbi:MAG TPA: hypothetical protein VGR21_13420 [Cryptosporangiaceae bacterium]|nr:hypothetical protein [Cryptosporangiaceae bacterium]